MQSLDSPVNLPHSATIARRISLRLGVLGVNADPEADALLERMDALLEVLSPFEEPAELPPFEVRLATARAAVASRNLVDEIERLGVGEERLGELVGSLFESLGLGSEAGESAARASEEPGSLMRQA